MTLDAYLRELRRQLSVGPLERRRILQEIEAHLEEAIARHGEEDAIASFGRPEDIAARFAPPSRGRRWALPAVAVTAAGAVAVAAIYGVSSPAPRVTAAKNRPPSRSFTISGVAAKNKVYEGTTSATVDFTGASLTGIVSGDDVSIDSQGISICGVALTTPVNIVGQAIDGEPTHC